MLKSNQEKLKELGLNKNYFAVMKIMQKNKYEYLTNLHKDIFIAHTMYEDDLQQTITTMTNIYYTLEEKRLILAFSKFLKSEGIYTHSNTFASSVNKTIFKVKPNLIYKVFLKYKKIIKLYDKFKENNESHNISNIK